MAGAVLRNAGRRLRHAQHPTNGALQRLALMALGPSARAAIDHAAFWIAVRGSGCSTRRPWGAVRFRLVAAAGQPMGVEPLPCAYPASVPDDLNFGLPRWRGLGERTPQAGGFGHARHGVQDPAERGARPAPEDRWGHLGPRRRRSHRCSGRRFASPEIRSHNNRPRASQPTMKPLSYLVPPIGTGASYYLQCRMIPRSWFLADSSGSLG